MDRYLLEVKMLIQVDCPNGCTDDIAANFYARISELVASEDHMLDAEVNAYSLPGNAPQPDQEER